MQKTANIFSFLLNLTAACLCFSFPFLTENAPMTSFDESVLANTEAVSVVTIGPGAPEDPCTVEVEAAAVPYLEKMGVQNWVDACLEAHAEESQP